MKKENILPGVVLTLVCAIVCGLLAVVNALTYDKIAEAEANKVQKSLVAVFGEDTYTETEASFEGVTAVYSSSSGLTIYDITADGYSKGGIRALIGIGEDGAVAGVGIVSCGETAGVGTKITAADYLARFTGAKDQSGYPDIISRATFSSNGLRRAVDLALQCEKEGQ